MKKNKLPFWQLSLIFGMITLLALGISYGYGIEQNTGMMSQMMGSSMGNMMGSMHVQNITIPYLIRQQQMMESTTGQNQDHASHHQDSSPLKTTHYLTTITIAVLLPLILAGTAFLAIIWFGKTGKGGGKH